MKIGNLDITSLKVGSADCKVYLGDTLLYPSGVPSLSGNYLTFIARENGTFKFSGNTVDYSIDSGSTWTTLDSNWNTPTVVSGHTIMWRASLTPTSNGIGRFSSSGNFDVEGNAMSLLYGDNFEGQTDLTGKNNAFYELFSGCTHLLSAERLSLPATTLTLNCYSYMFNGCTSLTTASELPATTLQPNCYQFMFYNCSELTAAPELPATTLADRCYSYMFNGCTSLTTAPELPATTLANWCYSSMFNGCSELTAAPELPATTLASSCYTGMFNGCTSLTTAPVLSATTLTNLCYSHMFNGCTSLNKITCLATNISATNCTLNWVQNVKSSGTFTKNPNMSGWSRGVNGIPYGWTVQDYV